MKAMVLCAGYGTRLGDLTREIPKPMLPLEGHPVLEYILSNLVRHGFEQIAINLHFRPEAIRDYFGDGSQWGGRIEYSLEPELLGTAGGPKKMADFLGGTEPFLLHYGDVITNQDFMAMLGFHQQRQALATLLVHLRARSMSVLGLAEDGRILRFLERPSEEERQTLSSDWVFSGVAICEPRLLDMIPPSAFYDLPRDVFTKLTASERLFAFPLTGQRCAIDSPERLEEAREGVRQRHYRVSLR